jgi:glutaredoxin
MARNSLKLLLVAALVATPAYAAKLYKWVDERGNVTYLDHPPPEGRGRVEEKTVRDRPGAAGSPAMAEAAAKAPVTLYMVSRCSSCEAARVYLKKRGVPFKEVDVSERNPQAQEEMRKAVGDLAVPTLTVGSKVMKGYLESLLEGELDAAGYPKLEAPAEAGAEGAAPAQ